MPPFNVTPCLCWRGGRPIGTNRGLIPFSLPTVSGGSPVLTPYPSNLSWASSFSSSAPRKKKARTMPGLKIRCVARHEEWAGPQANLNVDAYLNYVTSVPEHVCQGGIAQLTPTLRLSAGSCPALPAHEAGQPRGRQCSGQHPDGSCPAPRRPRWPW